MRYLVFSLALGLVLPACKSPGTERSENAATDGEDASLGGKLPSRAGRGGSGGIWLRNDAGAKPDAAAAMDATMDSDASTDAGPADAAPGDACSPLPAELCNGDDDDCDGEADEGFGIGMACDGSDADDCRQGIFACAADGQDVECEEAATVIAQESCDGTDNDCDDAVDEDFDVGEACDGADSDLCTDGVVQCAGTDSAACSDDAHSALDLCNGTNDDCDAASGDGSEDPLLATACDGSDGDDCNEGVWACASGELLCSDATGTLGDPCGGGDQDCDGETDEDSVRNNDPACSPPPSLGSLSGDSGAEILTASGYDERWYRVTVREDNVNSVYLSAQVTLASPPDADYDLYVYCVDCGGTEAGTSTAGVGAVDTVYVRADDAAGGPDDTFDIVIEVLHWSSNSCANWQLTVTGNAATPTVTCE